ncbi:MAG TPA: DMT family transporter [bacterium]|nr:DMT family transporter [bacterium]
MDLPTPHKTDAHIKAELVALLVVSIWGMSFAFQKVALEQFGATVFMALRYLGMLALSWGVLLHHSRRTGEPLGARRGDLPALALAGVAGYTLYIPLSTFGLSYTTPFSNALLIGLAPLFAAALLRILRLETITGGQYAGMLVALIGVAVFVLPALRRSAGSAGVGDLLSLAGAAFFAGYTVASKPLLARYSLPAMMAYTLTVGTVPVVLALLPSLAAPWRYHVTVEGWAAFAWTVIVPVYVAWSLWNWTIGRLGVARASVFMYLVPVAGGITSWIVFGEAFGLLKVTGAALVLAGLALARRSQAEGPREGRAPRPVELAPRIVSRYAGR